MGVAPFLGEKKKSQWYNWFGFAGNLFYFQILGTHQFNVVWNIDPIRSKQKIRDLGHVVPILKDGYKYLALKLTPITLGLTGQNQELMLQCRKSASDIFASTPRDWVMLSRSSQTFLIHESVSVSVFFFMVPPGQKKYLRVHLLNSSVQTTTK